MSADAKHNVVKDLRLDNIDKTLEDHAQRIDTAEKALIEIASLGKIIRIGVLAACAGFGIDITGMI